MAITNWTTEHLYKKGLISRRAYNVCIANRLQSVNSIVSYIRNRKSFLNLRKCGKFVKAELDNVVNIATSLEPMATLPKKIAQVSAADRNKPQSPNKNPTDATSTLQKTKRRPGRPKKAKTDIVSKQQMSKSGPGRPRKDGTYSVTHRSILNNELAKRFDHFSTIINESDYISAVASIRSDPEKKNWIKRYPTIKAFRETLISPEYFFFTDPNMSVATNVSVWKLSTDIISLLSSSDPKNKELKRRLDIIKNEYHWRVVELKLKNLSEEGETLLQERFNNLLKLQPEEIRMYFYSMELDYKSIYTYLHRSDIQHSDRFFCDALMRNNIKNRMKRYGDFLDSYIKNRGVKTVSKRERSFSKNLSLLAIYLEKYHHLPGQDKISIDMHLYSWYNNVTKGYVKVSEGQRNALNNLITKYQEYNISWPEFKFNEKCDRFYDLVKDKGKLPMWSEYMKEKTWFTRYLKKYQSFNDYRNHSFRRLLDKLSEIGCVIK